MASVWFVGRSDRRVIKSADWDEAGTDDTGDFTWDRSNGFSYPESAFTVDQLAYLDSLNTEFWVGAPDGPRTVVIADPVGYVTEVQVREIIADSTFTGLTPGAVGLGNVNNTSDAAKPVSTAQALALAGKADYPAGGTDGQHLAKSGNTTVWVAPAQSSSYAVTIVDDPDAPSGKSVQVVGSGVTLVSDPDAPSGTSVSLNAT